MLYKFSIQQTNVNPNSQMSTMLLGFNFKQRSISESQQFLVQFMITPRLNLKILKYKNNKKTNKTETNFEKN